MLLCSAPLTIISIQPQISFSVDNRTCFQICCSAVWSYNSLPCWTPTIIPFASLGLRQFFSLFDKNIHVYMCLMLCFTDLYSEWLLVYICICCSRERFTHTKKNYSRYKTKRINLPDISCGFLSSSWRQQNSTLSLHAGQKQSLIHPQITTSGPA